MKLSKLKESGYDLKFKNHASAILNTDFKKEISNLVSILSEFEIPVKELIISGGGESKITQRLRNSLTELGWKKHKFEISKTVDAVKKSSISHEVDHVVKTSKGTLALEIEWNNKDTFFDRDLENFRRLHAENAISVGIVITRGESLQENLIEIVGEYASCQGITKIKDVKDVLGINLSERQRKSIISDNSGEDISQVWAQQFVTDKFTSSTTHWSRLIGRIDRGLGNPCPLCLIGIPSNVVK